MESNVKNKKLTSLQAIEDFYIDLGYRENRLRTILSKDIKYQELLKKKKERLASNVKVGVADKKKYALSTDLDFEILDKCKKLEKTLLSKNDKEIVALIKSQLQDDWRAPLLKFLDILLKQYRIK